MFYRVAKNSKFPADKWRFDKTHPHRSVALSKSNVFLLIFCKLKTNFIAKSQLLYMGVRLRESVNKREIQFSFSKWPRPLMRECPLTGMCKHRV